ncbi:30S ribosomal protein S15 [Candidatus Parcubacteria bacterium]|nr:MAG: 30S ribosomal protein S15 [Candidatus Parcubacteria bacterium]
MLTSREKRAVIDTVKTGAEDTGSSEVQVALLSEEIARLTAHLKKHPKDHHSRRGLLAMVVRRRKLLEYLRGSAPKRYATVTRKLGLKR